jgi:hypothetical protein
VFFFFLLSWWRSFSKVVQSDHPFFVYFYFKNEISKNKILTNITLTSLNIAELDFFVIPKNILQSFLILLYTLSLIFVNFSLEFSLCHEFWRECFAECFTFFVHIIDDLFDTFWWWSFVKIVGIFYKKKTNQINISKCHDFHTEFKSYWDDGMILIRDRIVTWITLVWRVLFFN